MRSLPDGLAEPSRRNRLAEIAEDIAGATSLPDVQALLHAATLTLGAQRSFFVFIKSAGRDTRYDFVLDSDPTWWHRYCEAWPTERNPWLAYALREPRPVRASQLRLTSPDASAAMITASEAGFTSALLVPAHSGDSHASASLLCFGHSKAGFFEEPAFSRVWVAARSVAAELHDWWEDRCQRALLQGAKLTENEIRLLERHAAGLSSKQIARDLQTSFKAVNSQFQRIRAKLGVHSTGAAARTAVDCRLIVR